MTATYTQVDGVHKWVGVGATETCGPVTLLEARGLAMTVQAAAGGGTGFNGGTLTIYLSQDNATWTPAKDVLGNSVAFTADGIFEVSTGSRYVKGVSDGSISDVDLFITIPA